MIDRRVRADNIYGGWQKSSTPLGGVRFANSLYLRLNPPLRRKIAMATKEPKDLRQLREDAEDFLSDPETERRLD
eukprot:COSAG02_NODE_46387_length_349_cov_0.820000_1_plen_74_part_01